MYCVVKKYEEITVAVASWGFKKFKASKASTGRYKSAGPRESSAGFDGFPPNTDCSLTPTLDLGPFDNKSLSEQTKRVEVTRQHKRIHSEGEL